MSRVLVGFMAPAFVTVAILLHVHAGPRTFARKTPVMPEHRGLVILVNGVGGKIDIFANAAEWAFPHAGITHEIQNFDWTHGTGRIFKDLQDTQHCLQKAHELAAYIGFIKSRDPRRPVYLVGKSGGSGLVLAAAEQLPPLTLERIILLSPAVAPTYDLRPALWATRHEIVSFNSSYDRFILGWGTSQFGTIDRFYGPSAGLKNFIVPASLNDADRELYGRLVQIRWNPRLILEGHTGGHLGTSMPMFLEKEVAPWLK
ncbi:MAG TPA: alpha/beta hydrolase [Gemmataceae bacterium]|nr:alpha/beta hydrolase [Gemmataceae bacterium]